MDMRLKRAARRSLVVLLLAGGLGGCVYAPPYASAYDPYYSGYPTYVGPPVSVGLGFGFYGHDHGGYRGGGYGGRHGRR
jgi:hypothetical protein